MNAFQRLSNNLKTLNLVEMIQRLMQEDEPLLLALQKDQLYAGQDANGDSLRPSYLEDPYFKSRDAAQRYSDWKDRLDQRTPNEIFHKRPAGTPNLIITGTWFYNTLVADVGNGKLVLRSDSWLFPKLETKYGNALLGLNQTALRYYVEEILFPRLQRETYAWLNR
jgi:hypothetical protein